LCGCVSPARRVCGIPEEEGCAGLRDGFEAERESFSAPVAETIPMATAVQKITLSSSRDIPFNKLVLSQSNVRRVKAADQARYEPDSGGGLPRHHR